MLALDTGKFKMNARERKISEEELSYLQEIQRARPHKWSQGFENFIVLLAASLLLYVIIWIITGWITNLIFDLECGYKSTYAVPIVLFGIVICVIYSAISTFNWLKTFGKDNVLFDQDLLNGMVVEESYEFKEAVRFQEQEHGGLVYFLRENGEEAFVVYDDESANLDANDEDPLDSSFTPKENLFLVRLPKSQFPFNKQFYGNDLEIIGDYDLLVDPGFWPEDDGICKVKWDDLEEYFQNSAYVSNN